MSRMMPFGLRLVWYRIDKEALVFLAILCALVATFAGVLAAVFAYKDDQRARLLAAQRQNLTCLARNIYFEARGEPEAGQYAVAEVTMNRRASPLYPDTVCEVVHQPGAFSWTELKRLPEPQGEEWERAWRIAGTVYYAKRAPGLEGALYYHASRIRPAWAKGRERVARIGRHVFYK